MPNGSKCCLCEINFEDGAIIHHQKRPSGNSGAIQTWPFCDSCWQKYQAGSEIGGDCRELWSAVILQAVIDLKKLCPQKKSKREGKAERLAKFNQGIDAYDFFFNKGRLEMFCRLIDLSPDFIRERVRNNLTPEEHQIALSRLKNLEAS